MNIFVIEIMHYAIRDCGIVGFVQQVFWNTLMLTWHLKDVCRR